MFGAADTSGYYYHLPNGLVVVLGLGAIAAALLALFALFRTLWKIAAAAGDIQEALPTLLSIAKEFQPDSGKTLHDRLVRLDTVAASTNEKVDKLWSYSHEFRHDMANIMAGIAPTNEMVLRLLSRLNPSGPEPPPKGN